MNSFVSVKFVQNDKRRVWNYFFLNDKEKPIENTTPMISKFLLLVRELVCSCVWARNTWRDSACMTSRDLAKRIKSKQVCALFPPYHSNSKKKVDFFVAKQTGMWSALFCRPHQGWFRNRDKYTWPFRGLQILPRNCFQRITLNSVLCEALGDRISGDSSGINFMANSSDSTRLDLGKKVSCTIFLLFFAYSFYGWRPTDSQHPFGSKKHFQRGIIAKSMNTLTKHFIVFRL